MKHLQQDELALHYFGDDTPAQHAAAAAHLRECTACRADFDALSMTLATVREAQPPIPERAAGYEDQVWNNLRAHLPAIEDAAQRERKEWWAWMAQPRRWAVAGAMAAIIAAAFVAGRFSKTPQPPAQIATNTVPATQPPVQSPENGSQRQPSTETPEQSEGGNTTASARPPRTNVTPVNVPPQREGTRDRILLVAVGDHLERSQMVLMELVNAPDKGEVDISGERERAEDLLNSNRLYRMTAQDVGDRKLASVLDELERTLIEIAHEPSKVNSDELKDLQRRIEAQGVLFKVRVVGANIRDQKKPESKPRPKSQPKAEPRAQQNAPGVTEKTQSI
jgi:hypothetical protein